MNLDDLYQTLRYKHGIDKPWLTKPLFRVWITMHQILCTNDKSVVAAQELLEACDMKAPTLANALRWLIKLGFAKRMMHGQYVPLIQ